MKAKIFVYRFSNCAKKHSQNLDLTWPWNLEHFVDFLKGFHIDLCSVKQSTLLVVGISI